MNPRSPRSILAPVLVVTAAAWVCAGSIHGAAAADVPWAVKSAPYRAVIRLHKPPANPDAGVEIDVPDLGVVHPGASDYALADPAGHPLPVVAVWQGGEGRATRLLAGGLSTDQDYYLYIGGARGTTWTPKTSLLLETRRTPAGHADSFSSLGGLEAAWSLAAPEGAAFVDRIHSGNNPFGEQTNFLSHYSGYLAPFTADVELSTDSSDASFVLVNDQLFLDSPGKHGVTGLEKLLRWKKLGASAVPVKIDYYHSKADEGDPTMCLFWKRNGGGVEAVPTDAWLHPGAVDILRYEGTHGGPVPAATIDLPSYLGWAGSYLYEMHGKLMPTDLEGTSVEWRFDDGGVVTGPTCNRLLSATPAVQHVTVVMRHGAETLQSGYRIDFYGEPPEMADSKKEHTHYVRLLTQLDPTKLTPSMLGVALPFLAEHAFDAQIAPFANAWLATRRPTSDPLWLTAEAARVRTIAETNPKAALAELTAIAPPTAATARALDLLELEIIVFYAHDAALLPRAQQIAFRLDNTPEARLAAIRVGDLYRLTGDVRQAIARYQAVQPPDDSGGRKLPTEDQAYSMTVDDLLGRADRKDAEAKLTEWELAHPMAKFTTDFLLLRSRVMERYGRWRESLTELDAFAASHPDSAYQIEVDFYRGRALYELGLREDARKIWTDIVNSYPKSEYADSSRQWLKKL